MIVLDRTGRKLKLGQICDVFLMGMFQAKLIGIKDQPIQIPGHQPLPPHIILAASITPYIGPNGYVGDVYIVQDADPRDPITKGEGSNLIAFDDRSAS